MMPGKTGALPRHVATACALGLGLGLMACAGPEGAAGTGAVPAAEAGPEGAAAGTGRAGPPPVLPDPNAPCPVDQAGPVGAVDPACDAQFLPPE
jgi:hypothetical protein